VRGKGVLIGLGVRVKVRGEGGGGGDLAPCHGSAASPSTDCMLGPAMQSSGGQST